MPLHHVESTLNVLGAGSCSSVHRGPWNGVDVAIKTVILGDSESRDSFWKQTKLWHKLDHTNVVRLFCIAH